MSDVKVTVKDLKTWMSSDACETCKEISVTIEGQSSYIQGSKHINPAVYYAAERIQELEKLLATSTMQNNKLAALLKICERFIK